MVDRDPERASFSRKLDEALQWAHELHRYQQRKGSGVPYVTHLLGVASLVGEYGGSEDQVIAGLLHDAIEDCHVEHPDIRDQIEARFGADVLAMVEACTDADVTPKPPWKARKRAYLDALGRKGPDSPSLIVSMADKVHNLRAIVADYDRIGEELWDRFTADRDDTVGYYREIGEIFAAIDPGPLQRTYQRELAQLEARLS